jgi:hypothetical protein
MSILIEFVSSRFFLFKLAHGLYVILPIRFGNVSCLTHASPSFSQPSYLSHRSSRAGTFTPWNRIRRSKRRLLERFRSQIRFCWPVSSGTDFPVLSQLTLNENRLLFMGSTSCIIVGFSFASAKGCQFGYLPLLPGNSLNAAIQGQRPRRLR